MEQPHSMSELDGVRNKIARVDEHLRALRDELTEFARSKPYSCLIEVEPESGDQILKVIDEPAPPPDLPVIGDILYNMRSALDHLAHALVLKAGRRVPGNYVAWPICDVPQKWAADRRKSKTAGMNDAMKEAVKAYQPCFGRNSNINKAMWGLEEYGNIDKHRRLLVWSASSDDYLWSGGEPTYIHHGAVYQECVLLRFPAGQHQAQFHIMPSVAFGEPPHDGKEVHRTLGFAHHIVSKIVNEFEETFF